MLGNMKRRYKHDLLLRLLNKENEGLNIAEFNKTLTILDAVMMSDKSWRERESRPANRPGISSSVQPSRDLLHLSRDS